MGRLLRLPVRDPARSEAVRSSAARSVELGSDESARTAREDRSSAAAGWDLRDILPMGVLLWVGSAVRVAVALVHREVFGLEQTAALICVLLIPGLFWSTCARVSRARKN